MYGQVGSPLTETRAGTSPVSKTFSYDQMDRLTGVCFQAGSCPGGADPFVRWDYDGVGNRLSEQRPTGTTTYTYDQMDRMLTAGATSYTYDRNGNQLSAGSRTFTWDLANRLKTTTASGTTTTYAYDGDGKRLQASTGNGSNQKTNFSWDPNNGLPLLVREGAGNGSLLRRYVNGAAGPIFMSTTASNAFYYHPDALGSVRDVTDSAGVTQNTYDYEPYGSVRTQSGTLSNFVKFTGQYQDPTGLYHLRARQYDPATGRFLTGDPVGQTSDGSSISLYAYADNRPIVLLDPSGMVFEPSRLAMRSTFFATSRLSFSRGGFGLPNLCIPGWSACSQPPWVTRYAAEFVATVDEVIRTVAPYASSCATSGAEGALLARWAFQGVVAGATVGCALGVVKVALKDKERLEAAVDIIETADAVRTYREGLLRRFPRNQARYVFLQLDAWSVRGNTAIRARVTYIMRVR